MVLGKTKARDVGCENAAMNLFPNQFMDTWNSLQGPGPGWCRPLLLSAWAVSSLTRPAPSSLATLALLLSLQHCGHISAPEFWNLLLSICTTLLAHIYMAHSFTSFRSFLKHHFHPLNIPHQPCAPHPPPLLYFFVSPAHLLCIFLNYCLYCVGPWLEHKIHGGRDFLALFFACIFSA